VQLISDANLFKTAAATARIWKLELSAAPGIRTRTFPTPDGLPPGATFRYESDGRHACFEVGWRQGPALAFVILFAHPTDRFTATAVHRISAFLGTAGRAEARRIATVERTAESA